MPRDPLVPESPVPYRGSLAQRRARLGESYVERSCGWDRTGKRIYAYNTLGFRGAEFHADAPLRVYIFGESTVFGTGLQL